MNTRDHAHDTGQLIEPDLDAIHPSPTNPRSNFPAEALQGLADSIKVDGVMQPILVREMPQAMREQLGTRAQLEIVAGERRYRAAILAGRQTIPAILRQLTDEQVIRMQLVENLQREGLNPLEEAEGIARLFATGLSAEQIAEQIGKGRSKAYVYAKAKLLALCNTVRAALVTGRIAESVALLIARLPLEDDQIDALKYATTRDEYTGEPPSVRTVKAHIANSYTKALSKAPFDPADADLLPTAGTCTACPSRLGNIDHTELLAQHVPVPAGCARPNKYGVFEKQHTLSTRAGNAVLLIHRSNTADGWRAANEFSTPTGAWSDPISLNTPAHEKEAQAIEYATRKAHPRIERDNDLPDKHKKHLLRWLEKLNTEAGGGGITTTDETTQSVSQLVRYRHPHIPGLTWTGKGKKPQWVTVWLADGNPLADLEAHQEELTS